MKLINFILQWFQYYFGAPKTYFTSDLHFGHLRVIEYCNRPFKSIDEMTEHIVKTWNKTVRKKDTIYVLGDFSLNKKWSRILIPKLNGMKIIIAGNHDECFIAHKKSAKRVEDYLSHGWNEVHPFKKIIQLKNGTFAQLCHLPYRPDYNEDSDRRYIDWRPNKDYPILIHGHSHGRYIKNKTQIDVGWDAHEGIIDEDRLIEIINDTREFIPSHITEFYKTRNNDVN